MIQIASGHFFESTAATTIVVVCSILVFPVLGYGQLDIEFEPMPNADMIDSPNPVQALNVGYGDLDESRQAFHIFLPDTQGEFPLVIYYHGGGFVGGNRDTVFTTPNLQRSLIYFLENNIAFASVGYRLIDSGNEDQGVIKCLGDSKRALQFIRHFSSDLKIDPERIALMGSSAGAGTALWLSTRDDMADPAAPDPVLRESTRVSAVRLGGCQATYDVTLWESIVFSDFDVTLEDMIALLGFDRLSDFYGGLDSVQQLFEDPALVSYRQDVDMLYHISRDDPPIYILSRSNASLPGEDLFHHGAHSLAIQSFALKANLPEVKARINYLDVDTTAGECGDSFLARHLSVDADLVGDVNQDGLVNLLDVGPFIDVVTNQSPFTWRADINCDGNINLLDVQGMVALLVD